VSKINFQCVTCSGPNEVEGLGPDEFSRVITCEHCGMLSTLQLKPNRDGGHTMSADQQVMSGELTPERKELLEKLRTLQKQHNDVSDMKKAMAKDYNDQLKDLASEIKDILAELDGMGA